MRFLAIERLQVPAHYQDRINQVAGFNRYGQPNFRIAWAQSETTRQGGLWEDNGEQFEGYRDVYKGDGLPHWMLMQWVDAGRSAEMPHLLPESDVRFYIDNRCQKTGLQLLGEYPYHGSYQVVLPLVAKWMEKGELKIRAFPLSTEIVEMMIPIIKASLAISLEAKMQFMQEAREKDDAEFAMKVEDAYQDAKLSTAARGSKWIQDKVRDIERYYNSALITKMHRDRQFQSKHRI